MIDYESLFLVNREFTNKLKIEFEDFLDSGWYILGRGVEKFENEFAAYHGVKHCIGVASGLDALLLSIIAFDFEKGSEIIVPSNTYIATIIAIMRAGMVPILVEPDINTYNIDPKLIVQAITSKTVAILPVHLYGKVSAMTEICEISSEYGLEIIEDCAQAHGGKYKNKFAGTFGVGAFSFYPTKNLGALGDAGAIITDDDSLARKLKKLRNYGSNSKYKFEYLGYNSRLDELQALFLSVKLPSLNLINEHKRKLANLYLSHLNDSVILPCRSHTNFDVYHIFNIRHKNRDKLKTFLLTRGIKTEIHYPIPPHKQKSLSNFYKDYKFPISEEIHNTTLSLPISYCHTEEDIMNVIESINSFSL